MIGIRLVSLQSHPNKFVPTKKKAPISPFIILRYEHICPARRMPRKRRAPCKHVCRATRRRPPGLVTSGCLFVRLFVCLFICLCLIQHFVVSFSTHFLGFMFRRFEFLGLAVVSSLETDICVEEATDVEQPMGLSHAPKTVEGGNVPLARLVSISGG